MNVLKPLATLLSFVLLLTCARAQNLVPNPGFENTLTAYCGIQYGFQFNQNMQDWVNPTAGSPQIFYTTIPDTCYNFQPFSQYGGPIGLKGNQQPRSGDLMVGLWSYTIPNFNQRQYVQVQLSSPLEVGKAYVVEFYASLGDFMEFSIDKLGAYLSVSSPTSNNDGPLNFTPQVLSTTFVDDVTDWVLISDTIVAQEAAAWITIGNFLGDDSTHTQANASASGEAGTYGAFYFVDDVRVEEVTLLGTAELPREEVQIWPTRVTEFLNLKLPAPARVELRNSLGQMLLTREIGQGIQTLQLPDLAGGVYLVTVHSGEQTVTRRIVR